MTSFLDKLNLRPQERRLVVVVSLAVFAVLNVLLVFPQFGEVDVWKNRKAGAEKSLKDQQDEIRRMPGWTNDLKKLESEGYAAVGSEEAVSSMQNDVDVLAKSSGVQVERYDPVQRNTGGKTNAFFEEAGLGITVNTGEKELVDFLYNLGSRNAYIRVRTMSLSPDPTQTRLRGRIEFIQSFPKKTITRPTVAVAKAAGPTTPGTAAKKTVPTPAATNLSKATAPKATNAPTSGNWFTRLLARFTGGSSATNAPAKAPAKTNTAPKTPNLPAPK